MKIVVFQSNALILCLIISIFTVLEILIQNKILIKIIRIEKIEKTCISQIIIIAILRLIFPILYSKVAEAITSMIIYKRKLSTSIEKAIFMTVINISTSSIIGLIVVKILNVSLTNTISLISFCTISVLVELLIYLIINKLKISIDFPEYLNTNSRIKIIQICIISTVITLIDKIEIIYFIDKIPNIIYTSNIILLIVCHIISIKSIISILEIEKDINRIKDLEGSNDRLIKNYDNISSFKHDFDNIMQGIGGYITNKDLEGLNKMYKDIICECKDIENIKSFNKEVVNNPAVYNLINNKYLEAKKLDIKLKLEVYIDLETLKIKTYELCRILGILIDNAIEASKECEEKIVSIKFIKDNYNNRNLIIIENTCKNYLIDINKIKQKGFTTKKNKLFHGIGLWKVNQIIKKNENLRLYTSRDKLFKQQLEIYSWD